MKLAIISHTEHYYTKEGELVGWGPTISEINHLAEDFDEIIHVAFLYEEEPKTSSLPYTKPNIKFVALPVSGGKTWLEKTNILSNMPKTIATINSVLDKVDVFQFRTPIGFGVYLIPYLTHFVKTKGWYKYAGNWNQQNASLGYRLQRSFLKKQNRKVTINGSWPNQPENCLTFENPCLTLQERKEGKVILQKINYTGPFQMCFVGRLEDPKGVQRIIDAVASLRDKTHISNIHLVGDGERRKAYEAQVVDKNLPIQFHGFLSRDKVFDLYRNSHFLLLPSTASEGFPKVIAEAMNYGCIPIVSDVSSIGQYINQKNGFIVNPTTSEKLEEIFSTLAQTKKEELQNKAEKAYAVSEAFTFEHYRHRIQTEILE
ncbi:glycosyltransferase [Haloflavibacter putidus]|uniref:Glycosyltransferase family 4 protein n=1 Tax=Haloflavibacter putidus TaxID=2576776 RepID=A0A507Z8J6_9FLAO|nr:glycosyltransferase [Haloflavibacter putidus]TQD33830.1 glycosyltransferase family 4 protein [Haloflavibacter putidus]